MQGVGLGEIGSGQDGINQAAGDAEKNAANEEKGVVDVESVSRFTADGGARCDGEDGEGAEGGEADLVSG